MMASLTNRITPWKVKEERWRREFDELYDYTVGNLKARIEHKERMQRAHRVLNPKPRKKF